MEDLRDKVKDTFPEAFNWLEDGFSEIKEDPFYVLKRAQKTLSIAEIRSSNAGEDIYQSLHERRPYSWRGLKLYLGMCLTYNS